MRPLLALAPLLLALPALAAASAGGAVPIANATFVDETGAWEAHVRIHGDCNGPVTIELFVVRGIFGDYHEVQGESTMVPDPCLVRCLDCPVPFAWVIRTDGLLAGGGVAGFAAASSLEGPLLDGVLQVRHTPLL